MNTSRRNTIKETINVRLQLSHLNWRMITQSHKVSMDFEKIQALVWNLNSPFITSVTLENFFQASETQFSYLQNMDGKVTNSSD